MDILLILAWTLPLGLAIPAVHKRVPWSPALAAVPALCAALLVPIGTELELPWLLAGASFRLDEIGRIFLLFTAILWLVAGVYAWAGMRGDPQASRFSIFFLLAMAGNIWLIVSHDLIGFYTGFALMGLSSYGLVIHHGDRAALRAGKVYLVLTLCAEVTLFAAIVLIAAKTGSLSPSADELATLDDLTIALLLLGLAVKAGLVPLHVWLPLAHPAAPIPASAVLSGTMIKVAILGWLRYLPVGAIALPEWGLLFIFVGLLTAFVAIPIGLVQSEPKTLLAYSSISKMGLMALILGVMLMEPGVAPLATVGLALYAGHHALTKGGLFLGVGLRRSAPAQPFVLIGITWLALSLAAVPLTSGAVAKYVVKPALTGIDWSWFGVPIALTTLATAWLMARLLWIIWSQRPAPRSELKWAVVAWAALPTLVLLYPLVLGSPGAWLTDAGLILAAVVLALPVALLAQSRPRAPATVIESVPAGDLLRLVRPTIIAWRWLAARILRAADRALGRARIRATTIFRALAQQPLPDLDRTLRAWTVSGGLWLAIIASLTGLLIVAAPQWPRWSAKESRVERAEPGERSDRPAAPGGSAAIPADVNDQMGPPSRTAMTRSTETETKPEPASPPQSSPGPESAPVTEAGSTPTPVLQPEPGPPLIAGEEPSKAADEPRADEPIPDGRPDDAGERPAASSVCDVDKPYLFRHQASDEAVSLVRCIRVDGMPTRLDAPQITDRLVQLVQWQLADLGFTPGPIDGLLGPLTREAIRRFQTSQGLEATGAIDFDLLDRLQQAADAAPLP